MPGPEASPDKRFEELLDAAPDAIVGVDRHGRIALFNVQAERLFGYRREEILGEELEVLVPDGSREIHRGHRATYAADPEPRPMGAGMELAARRRDGTEFRAEISLSAVGTGDEILVAAGVRDLTERLEEQAEREHLKAQAESERFERRLQQSQRLESLGQLAGGVAHDFNNLLAVIVNYANFVAAELAAADDDGNGRWASVRADIGEIQRAADRATALTRQLLAFGRREVVQPRALSLNDVVRDIERLLRRTLGEHVELLTTLAADLRPTLADAGQLEQVLVNLAVNARDAMHGGGRLTIETGNLDVDSTFSARRAGLDPGRYVRLRVSDTGDGMAPEVRGRAFEPFFTTKPKGEGSGLGLATVYGIVKQAGGDIEIYSEEGLGTTISVLVPACDTVRQIDDPAREPKLGTGGEIVLIVEDEQQIRDVARRILECNGYTVLVATGGADAIRCAEQYPGKIDLLLTDVVMPGMQGKEVAERLLAARPQTRVLFMSGYAQPILASQGTLDAGVILVEKPFSERSLLAKVREALDRQGAPA